MVTATVARNEEKDWREDVIGTVEGTGIVDMLRVSHDDYRKRPTGWLPGASRRHWSLQRVDAR